MAEQMGNVSNSNNKDPYRRGKAIKRKQDYRYWLDVVRGKLPLPDIVRIADEDCHNAHWPDSKAVRYINGGKCVMCQRRAGQKFSHRGDGKSPQPKEIQSRWDREAYEDMLKVEKDLDWPADDEL